MCRPCSTALLIVVLALLGAASALEAAPYGLRTGPLTPADLVVPVQVGPGGAINPQKDCQTVRQCRFTPGGLFRGCVSSYSCRVCRFVAARCSITGQERTCRELRCDWGG